MAAVREPQLPALTDLPGVGPALAGRMIDHFGGRTEVHTVLQGAELDRLVEVEGVGEHLALALVQEYHGLWDRGSHSPMNDHDDRLELLATSAAGDLWKGLVKQMDRFAVNQYSRNQLRLLRPLTLRALPAIQARHERMTQALELFDGLGPEQRLRLRRAMADLTPLRKAVPLPRRQRRVVVVTDKDAYSSLAAYQHLCRLFHLEPGKDPTELLEYPRGVWVGPGAPGRLPLGWVSFPARAPLEEVLPEALLGWFTTNRKTLQALVMLWGMLADLGSHPLLEGARAPGPIDPPRLSHLLGLTEARRLEQTDERLAALAGARKELSGFLGDTQLWVNEQIEQRIQATSLTLEGQQILEALQHRHGHQLHGLVAAEMQPMLEEVTFEGVARVEAYLEPLGLTLTDELFTPSLPRELSKGQVQQLELQLERAYQQAHLEALTRLAGELAPLRAICERTMVQALSLSHDLTLADWADHYELTLPELAPPGVSGVAIEAGRHLMLLHAQLEGGPEVEPVSYGLGPAAREGDRQSVALLSGANSGGKTTLLELLFQTLCLTHAGLPVPAVRARVGLTQRLHLLAKATSTQSAGALERTLRELAEVIADPRPKVLLADELEAITEPGAGARIMAGLLEAAMKPSLRWVPEPSFEGDAGQETVTSPPNLILMVSHLAQQIVRAMSTPVRIDGIAAVGLDEHSQLIVDRTPRRNHLARSTPELIIKRLLEASEEGPREVLQEVMDRFDT